jgi:hypothetical protein
LPKGVLYGLVAAVVARAATDWFYQELCTAVLAFVAAA